MTQTASVRDSQRRRVTTTFATFARLLRFCGRREEPVAGMSEQRYVTCGGWRTTNLTGRSGDVVVVGWVGFWHRTVPPTILQNMLLVAAQFPKSEDELSRLTAWRLGRSHQSLKDWIGQCRETLSANGSSPL